MFCRKCGQQMDDFALLCPKCGTSTTDQIQVPHPPSYQQPVYQQPPYQQPPYQQPYQQPYSSAPVNDVPSGGMKFLSFLIPILGLILYFAWKDQKPISAKAMGKAAAIGFILGFILSAAYFILVFLLIGGISYGDYPEYYALANFVVKIFG